MSEVYAIIDVDGYVSQMREAAAKSISTENEDNLDQFITLKEVRNLLEEFCLGHDEQDRPLLDEDTNEKIFEETAIWIHNIGLAKLASQDLVECAWDNTTNEMVFWQKETKKEKKSNAKSRSRNKNMGDKK